MGGGSQKGRECSVEYEGHIHLGEDFKTKLEKEN